METYRYEILASVHKVVYVNAETPEAADKEMKLLAGIYLKRDEFPVIDTLSYEMIHDDPVV